MSKLAHLAKRYLATALSIFVLLEMLGAPRLIAQIASADGVECCTAGCENASSGHKCPPLCPTCTCSHASRLAMPSSKGRSIPPPPETLAFAPLAPSQVPPEPDPTGIFRPPRAPSLSNTDRATA